ncbi:MAG: dockerin type I domain-containing protein [Patescibacteria group bacterium]
MRYKNKKTRIFFLSCWLTAVAAIFISAIMIDTAKAASYAGLKISITPGPECYDGKDNDSDGKMDYPADSDCDSTNDNSEFPLIVNNVSSGGGGGSIAPITSVTLSGYAYPLNKITILKDGQIALTTIAGPDAIFNAVLTGLTEGFYNFSIYSEDIYGLKSGAFTFPVYITKGASTNIGGIFLAPTIKLDKESVKSGDNITILGQSAPNAEINITVNSEKENIIKTKTDQNGVYSYDFDTALLELGDHSAKSKSTLKKQVSSYSKIVGFKVFEDKASAAAYEEEKQGETAKGDFNNDNKVDLIDFSILSYWYKKPQPPTIVDMNKDGRINIIDFSILAFSWTG